ncbi:MAG TPA: glycosyltransferase family 4 protein [Levilinea sp.]|nr:glycosyltransferase family 4 protein [Levilinea sp.]
MNTIPARIGLAQRVLPSYRAALFDALASVAEGGLSVFAGQPRPQESIDTGKLLTADYNPAHNLHLLGGRFYLCYQGGLTGWLERWQPDVLITEANPRYLRTPAAVHWMHARRRPVIGWGLGAPIISGPLANARSAVRGRFLVQFDAMITYSRLGAGEYTRAGFPEERIFVAPNAAAPRPAHPPPERPGHFGSQGAVALFVGRLQERKRVDALLRACAALPEGQRPQLWIVGDGPARQSLERLAGQVFPAAHFFGAKQGEELAALFTAADLFVLPGTGGLAVQQAMSWGLPVIVAEADGTQSDLVRPQNGWALPPGDLDALTRSLTEALADPAHLRKMGKASYQIVAEEINLEHMVEVFAQAIAAVLPRGEA